MLTIAFLMFTLFICVAGAKAAPKNVRAYAHGLVLQRWGSEAEWRAFSEIVRRESGWDPCAHWPGVHGDCSYDGTNSCGLGQRNPCPPWMRGRLWETRHAQVRDVIAYIAGRYRRPTVALAYWNAHRSY